MQGKKGNTSSPMEELGKVKGAYPWFTGAKARTKGGPKKKRKRIDRYRRRCKGAGNTAMET